MSQIVDLPTWLKSVHRGKRAGNPGAVTLRRRYATTQEDLWEALTSPERLPRWFARPEGQLALGQTVVLHDTGAPISWTSEIRACEAPQRLVLGWRFNGKNEMFEHDDTHDEIEVRLVPDGEGTWLELEHRSPDARSWAQFTGLGWEGIAMGLAAHLEGFDHAPVFESGEVWPALQGAWAGV